MSCQFPKLFHDWDRWQEYAQRYVHWDRASGKTFDTFEMRQKRVCKRCGRTEDEIVRGS